MGMRGRDEHHKYRFGDFTLTFTSEGHEYVEFMQERGTKTRSGEGEAHQQRAFKPKMFATPACPDRCPVKLFKTFISHSPEGMNLPESPYYLSVYQKLNEHSKWYKCQPLGIHQINGFMKTLSEIADCQDEKPTTQQERQQCKNYAILAFPTVLSFRFLVTEMFTV